MGNNKINDGSESKSLVKKNKVKEFFSETRSELNKVTWPNRETMTKATITIIVIVVFFSVYIAGLDFILSSTLLFLQGRYNF
jgi:preprotein translocase subunit SecE